MIGAEIIFVLATIGLLGAVKDTYFPSEEKNEKPKVEESQEATNDSQFNSFILEQPKAGKQLRLVNFTKTYQE